MFGGWEGSFRLDIRKSFFSKGVVGCWNGLPKEVTIPWGVFQERLGVELRDVVEWEIQVIRWMVGLGDPRGLF